MAGSEPTVKLSWRDVDQARRRRVARAVRAGRAVDDPRDAPYAVAFAAWLYERLATPAHRVVLFHSSLFVFAVAMIASREWTLYGSVTLVYPTALLVAMVLWRPRLRARVAAARTANEELAALMDLPPVPVEFPSAAGGAHRFRLPQIRVP
jgi:hypothetical protein